MNKFREVQKCCFWTQKCPVNPILGYNKNLPRKKGFITPLCLLNSNFKQNIKKKWWINPEEKALSASISCFYVIGLDVR